MIDSGIKEDVELMRKYKDGADLDPHDEHRVRELASIGFMKTGISLKRQVVTAKPTSLGLKIIGDAGDNEPTYTFTKTELGTLLDLTEDFAVCENDKKQVELARERINFINSHETNRGD